MDANTYHEALELQSCVAQGIVFVGVLYILYKHITVIGTMEHITWHHEEEEEEEKEE